MTIMGRPGPAPLDPTRAMTVLSPHSPTFLELLRTKYVQEIVSNSITTNNIKKAC